MEINQDRLYLRLVDNLDELIKVYRGLLDIVRKEKELLLAADVEALNESNHNKENLLVKVKNLEGLRVRYAKEFSLEVGADPDDIRLLEIARKCSPEKAEKLRSVHAALDLILKRLMELNRDNEQYAQTALKSLNGAVGEIKGTLSGKNTYEKKGKMSYGPDKAGNLVSRQI